MVEVMRYRNNYHHKNYDSYFRIYAFFFSSFLSFSQVSFTQIIIIIIAIVLDCAMCIFFVRDENGKRKNEDQKKK